MGGITPQANFFEPLTWAIYEIGRAFSASDYLMAVRTIQRASRDVCNFFVDEEGYLFITDRIKDLVIKGGYNIYPSEIEGYLEAHPSIAEVAVIGIPDIKYGEALMAFVVKIPGQELTESAVIDFATSKITPFKAPSKVKFVDALPKSLVGKILKKELRNMV